MILWSDMSLPPINLWTAPALAPWSDDVSNEKIIDWKARAESAEAERDDLADRLGKISDVWDSCLGWPDTSEDKIRLGEVIRRYEQ